MSLPHRDEGTKTLPFGHSSGVRSVVSSAMSLSMSHSMVLTQNVSGRIVLTSFSPLSHECILERALALTFFDPGRYCELEPGEK